MVQRGMTIFLTGLPAAGKSTLARHLCATLNERGRTVTLLDSDLLRPLLSAELGFSHDHRDIHLRRVGFVASEVMRHGGLAVCAAIAPYASTRAALRRMLEPLGTFVLVHLTTPLSVCEARDPRGLYRLARRGEIDSFTGVSDPYETPTDADIAVDAGACSAEQATTHVLAHLADKGVFEAVDAKGLTPRQRDGLETRPDETGADVT